MDLDNFRPDQATGWFRRLVGELLKKETLEFDRKEIERLAGKSYRQIYRLTRKYCGVGPRRGILFIKLCRANWDLAQVDAPPVDAVFTKHGIPPGSRTEAVKCYRQLFGETPRETRKVRTGPGRRQIALRLMTTAFREGLPCPAPFWVEEN